MLAHQAVISPKYWFEGSDMTTQTYWAFVRTGLGSFIRVTIQAENFFQAQTILKNTYGTNLQSGPALVVD